MPDSRLVPGNRSFWLVFQGFIWSLLTNVGRKPRMHATIAYFQMIFFIHGPSVTLSLHASIVCVWINVVKYAKTQNVFFLRSTITYGKSHASEPTVCCTYEHTQQTTFSTESSDWNISANLIPACICFRNKLLYCTVWGWVAQSV